MSKPTTDVQAMTTILNALVFNGYSLQHVWDGEDEVEAYDVETAVNAVDAVDDARVYMTTPDGKRGWVWFVLGNDPEEVAADYTTNLDPTIENVWKSWE